MWHNSERDYRFKYKDNSNETKFRVVIDESDLLIIANDDYTEYATKILVELRAQIKNWNLLNPSFISSLSPLELDTSSPLLIQKMLKAGIAAKLGPFAAVAGSISQIIAEKLHGFSENVLVENGGDTYIFSNVDRTIGILPDPANNQIIGIKVQASDCPSSLCASSPRIGHSLSFGEGQIAVVRAKDGAIADAFATAFSNMLKTENDINRILKIAKKQKNHNIEGVFLQFGDKIGVWGKMELEII